MQSVGLVNGDTFDCKEQQRDRFINIEQAFEPGCTLGLNELIDNQYSSFPPQQGRVLDERHLQTSDLSQYDYQESDETLFEPMLPTYEDLASFYHQYASEMDPTPKNWIELIYEYLCHGEYKCNIKLDTFSRWDGDTPWKLSSQCMNSIQ